MKAEIDFTKGKAEFDRFLAMSLAVTKKSAREVVETNFRGVMRWVYSVTPPMGGRGASTQIKVKVRADGTATNTYSVDFDKGKRQGQRAIFGDVHHAFRPIPDDRKQWLATKKGQAALKNIYGPTAIPELLRQSPEALYLWYKSKQSKDKRIRGNVFRRAFARDIETVYQRALKQQGATAAGWVAGTMGAKAGSVPSWIRRHSGSNSGSYTEKSSPTELILEALNPSNHADSNRIQGQLNSAYQMQANTMARALAAYLRNK